ncbi:hypothetical protein HAX54_008193 [Datura stramonium]|uniref:Uncharacterized protein n=1 Tax=Datura stramonium TaxID=4076 RepID=A0ABS8TFE2_DATST|nr:hypothetical protein [Datura stramonium]
MSVPLVMNSISTSSKSRNFSIEVNETGKESVSDEDSLEALAIDTAASPSGGGVAELKSIVVSGNSMMEIRSIGHLKPLTNEALNSTLLRLGTNNNDPWCRCRDFNAPLSDSDRIEGQQIVESIWNQNMDEEGLYGLDPDFNYHSRI